MSATCLNCDTAYSGNFCPQCGQKKDTHRLAFASILHDIPHSVFHIDKGLFFTFIQLLYKPGAAIRDYISGKRVRYFSPFAYLFLLCAVSSFIAHWSDACQHTAADIHVHMLYPRLSAFFAHYPALILCCTIPFIAIWSWLFNRATQYNYWENFILNTYLVAQFNIFFILKSLMVVLFGMYLPSATPVIIAFMSYMVFAYLQFFQYKRAPMRTLKNICMFTLIAFTLITCLSITGYMTPWWHN